MGIHNILSVRGIPNILGGAIYLAWGYNISGDTKYPVTLDYFNPDWDLG